MDIQAEEWYKDFLDDYAENEKIKSEHSKVYKKKGYIPPSKDWTIIITDLLTKLGRELNYEVQTEKLGRFDVLWKDGNRNVVAIEHENNDFKDPKNLNEINKLISFEAPLRVLISYTDEKDFNSKVEKLKDYVSNKFKGIKFSSEFLLIMTTYQKAQSPRDQYWVAYHYYPATESRLILIP